MVFLLCSDFYHHFQNSTIQSYSSRKPSHKYAECPNIKDDVTESTSFALPDTISSQNLRLILAGTISNHLPWLVLLLVANLTEIGPDEPFIIDDHNAAGWTEE